MTIQAAASLGLLLIAPLNPSLFIESSCLSENFLGHYKDGQSTASIFHLTTPECINAASNNLLSPDSHILLSAPNFKQQLVWLEQESVEESLLEQDRNVMAVELLNIFSGTDQYGPHAEQQILATGATSSRVVYRSEDSALLSLSLEEAYTIDQRIPRFWKSTLLPTSPSPYHVVSEDSVTRVRHALNNLKFNPSVAAIVNNISIPQIRNDLRFLTGEDGKSGIVSRHSFSKGSRTAANWIKARIEETGASCRLESFRVRFAPNVIWCDILVNMLVFLS